MAANMYRVGDYVYFETSSSTPYQVRRIEELNKTATGNVEAKVMCFYRRRDISSSLIQLADKHQSVFDREEDDDDDDDEEEGDKKSKADSVENEGGENGGTAKKQDKKENSDTNNKDATSNSSNGEKNSNALNREDLDDKQKHQLKHRELFLSRQVETLPATHIRGKCSVTLLNETESLLSYLNKDETFFYSLVYDPQQKTLLADKGEIRVGSRYQADVSKSHKLQPGESDGRRSEDLEQLVWSPSSMNGLADKKIDQFLVIARSVGTFARALDCTSTVRQPSLHMSAAAASRDITLFHAMDILHKHKYNISSAISSMVPGSGPVLCRDEMEEWSASEANLFEDALDKYGKDFNDIRQDFLPWKSLKSIVEYYYMWKTTDRYVQQKRIKAAEAESKLKQVYIPNYNKPNPAQLQGNMNGAGASRPCESCYTSASPQWFAWGPVQMACRLCGNCWAYWKKYGGLKMPTRLDGSRPAPGQREERIAQLQQRMHRCTIQGCGKEFRMKNHLARHLATAHGLAIRAGSPRPVMKTRAAFCLITTPLTRMSRQICKEILAIRKAARLPFHPINIALIKQECQMQLPKIGTIKPLRPRKRKSTNFLATRRGIDITKPIPAILEHTAPIKEPAKYAFPPRGPEIRNVPSDYVVQRAVSPKPPSVPSSGGHNSISAAINNLHQQQNGGSLVPGNQVNSLLNKKRAYEETNGIDEPSQKRMNLGVIRQGPSSQQKQAMPNQLPRGSVINQNGKVKTQIVKGGKKFSWMDAPDDVYFVATDATRKLRKHLNPMDFRKVARKPGRKLNMKMPFSYDAIMSSIPPAKMCSEDSAPTARARTPIDKIASLVTKRATPTPPPLTDAAVAKATSSLPAGGVAAKKKDSFVMLE